MILLSFKKKEKKKKRETSELQLLLLVMAGSWTWRSEKRRWITGDVAQISFFIFVFF